jgi:hypothetical protein
MVPSTTYPELVGPQNDVERDREPRSATSTSLHGIDDHVQPAHLGERA